MRKFVLHAGFFLCILYSGDLFAQNKTLGVGVATPNPNAALHVESPTGNQGFILPRLTTTQRTASAFTTVLTSADNGLMVYDTDLKTIFVWNGISWQSTGEVAGGIKLTYPYKDSVAVATGTSDLFALKYNNPESKRVMRIENQSTANGSSTLSVSTLGTGLSGYFQVANPTSTSSTLYATTNSNAGGGLAPVAVYGESTGTGSLGASFRINNAANTFPALFAETTGVGNTASLNINNTTNSSPTLLATTNGTGSAGKFIVNNIDNVSPAIWAETNSNQPLSAPIYGRNTGIGDVAASFRIENPANASSAAFAETNGSGAAFFGNQLGMGRGGQFQIQNIDNPEAAVRAFTNGMGSAGFYTINNQENSADVIFATTNGSGAAIHAENTGTGAGFAGMFNVTSATNNYPAIQASSAGTGSGVRVMQSTGTGAGMDVFMQNMGSSAPGLAIDQAGLGNAGSFIISNSTSNAPALNVNTNGIGPALQLNQPNKGLAIEMINGGLKYSVVSIDVAGPITDIAGIYKVSVAGTFALPTNIPEGTFCKIFNSNLTEQITIDPVWVLGTQSTVSISAGSLMDFVFINGNWYENP